MAAPKNPAGAKSDKLWRDAVMRAVRRQHEGKGSPQAIERLADKVVALGLAGDMQAIKEIGDRLDGRPTQAVTGPDGGAINVQVVTGVPRAGSDGV